MKTIGILGGMSFESTVEYYRIINEEVNKRLGGLQSAKMLIESYDFSKIEKLQSEQNWELLGKILTRSAQNLEKIGADYIAIATNTMHLLAPLVQENISIPLIHIADAAGNYIKKKNIDCVALFGTKYTMTKPFYKDKLKDEFKINVIIPDENEKEVINSIIYNELCMGIIKEESRKKLDKIIDSVKQKGAEGVVLGCTELPNIIKQKDDIEIIDTTRVHCLEIVDKILG